MELTQSPDGIEPLEPELWFQALERLSSRQPAAESAEVAHMLRHALHLVQLTPGPLKGIVQCHASESRFEEFLDCGALDSAAIALIGSPMCFELACTLSEGQRRVEARVWLPAQTGRPSAAVGNCVPGALVGAWSTCLAALRQRSRASGSQVPHRSPHTAPPAPHQKSSEH